MISASSTAAEDWLTVKRMGGGLVSNHINDHVQPGDEIDLLAPFGGFCLDPEPRARRTHYFFAAGSGITPLFAMINAVLDAEPYSVAHLAYGKDSGKPSRSEGAASKSPKLKEYPKPEECGKSVKIV